MLGTRSDMVVAQAKICLIGQTSSRRLRQIFGAFGILLASLLLAGCNGKPAPIESATSAAKARRAANSIAKDGDILLEVTCVPAKISLSGEAVVEIIVTRPKALEFTPPDREAMSDVFVVRDFQAKLPSLDGDKVVVRHIYKVEPVDVGKQTIPPLIYHFEPADGEPFDVATKPVEFEVTTMIANDDRRSLGDLEAADRPKELPANRMKYVVLAAAAISCLALVVTALVIARRRKVPVASALTPGEIAARELQALKESGIATTDVKEFYVRLTSIVRRYVEQTTGIRAPEQTTDEFLREINQRRLFSSSEHMRFGEFLESADLVKYAAYAPSENDIEVSVTRAARFVTLTGGKPTLDAEVETITSTTESEVSA